MSSYSCYGGYQDVHQPFFDYIKTEVDYYLHSNSYIFDNDDSMEFFCIALQLVIENFADFYNAETQ